MSLVCLSADTIAAGRFLRETSASSSTDWIQVGRRQGFAVSEEHLEEIAIPLVDIPLSATLDQDGVEVLDLREALQTQQVNESNIDVSSHEMRMSIGRVMLDSLTRRFQRHVVHVADTSRIADGSVYGEATVRNTTSRVQRGAHHVVHMDKCWTAIADMLGGKGNMDGLRATASAQWPLVKDDFREQGLSRAAYERIASEQNPGTLGLWLSLTPGGITQHPVAVLMNDPNSHKSFIMDLEDSMQAVATLPVQIKTFNDTITVLRSSMARNRSLRWGFRPAMAFGQALLFYLDRTAHGAVRLQDVEDSERVSAEMRVLVTDRTPSDSCKSQAWI